MAAAATNADAPSSYPKDVRPPMAKYTPGMWGNISTSFSLDQQVQEKYGQAIEALKDEALAMLMAKGNTTSDKLILIDTLERLGVAYHFEEEIENQLREIFKFHSANDFDDLFTVALQFQGEEVLDEAVAFAIHHLDRMVQQLPSPLQEQVKRALQQSLHRGVPRLETRYYISFYEKDDSRNEHLLKFAKLDFNYLQNMYKSELCEISRWWKEFDLNSKLPFVRDRVVEIYLWSVAYRFEPQYSYVRAAVAEGFLWHGVIDDTYDNYATLEEATVFTECLQRWNIDEIDRLPDYMKIVYKFLLSMFDDFEREASERGKSFAVPCAIETVKKISRNYLKELMWFRGRQMPTFEEYIDNTVSLSGIPITCILSTPGMKSVSKEVLDWLMTEPEIVKASSDMCRHLNNIGSHEKERKNGVMLTPVTWYMEEHGVSMQETIEKFVELTKDAWKVLNKEWLTETSSKAKGMTEMEMLILNYARSAEATYRTHEDKVSNPEATVILKNAHGAELNCMNFADKYSSPEAMVPEFRALFVDPIII